MMNQTWTLFNSHLLSTHLEMKTLLTLPKNKMNDNLNYLSLVKESFYFLLDAGFIITVLNEYNTKGLLLADILFHNDKLNREIYFYFLKKNEAPLADSMNCLIGKANRIYERRISLVDFCAKKNMIFTENCMITNNEEELIICQIERIKFLLLNDLNAYIFNDLWANDYDVVWN